MKARQEVARALAAQVFREAAWAPALVLAVYLVTARVFHLFTVYPDLDIPLHFAGGLAAAYFFLRCLQIASRFDVLGKPNRLANLLLAFSLTCVAAVAWEFAEYASDRLLGTHEQLGLDDTMGDLLLGILGSLVLLWSHPGTRQDPRT